MTPSDIIASILAIVGIIVYLLFPFTVLMFIKRNINELNSKKRHYGSLYADLRTHKLSTALYMVLFMLRRLLFAVSAVFLTRWPLVQVNLLFLQSLTVVLYLLHFRPFEDPIMNKLEIFNELCILLVTYPSLLFTGFVSEPLSQYYAGWLMIVFIILNILVNMLAVLYQGLCSLILFIKRIRFKLRVRKSIKKSFTRRLTLKLG